MAIASLSFSAPLPVYNSIGSHGTIFGGNSIATQGDVVVNTNGAPASSGKATVLTSNLTANGLSYTPQATLISGNQLTVYYNLTGNTNSNLANNDTALQTLQAADQGSAVASGLYGSGINITPEGSQTNGNITTTAYEISLNGPVNNTIGTVNQQTGYSVSNSSDGSSLTLEGVSSIGSGLKVTYQLSDAAPAAAPQAATLPPTSADTGNTGLPASLKGITTIGDLLASANGLSFGSTLTGALQALGGAGQSTGSQTSGSILAGVLDPNLNLSPSTPLQISDFLNTSPASPSAPANPYTSSSNTSTTSNADTNNFTNNAGSSDQGGTPSGTYTAFADVGASTIRGGNLNVVA